MHRPTKIEVTQLNPHLICVLCGGYLIDATTIIECLHSFCRTCITRYLEGTKFCPICDVQVHKTRPLLNIRPDKTLQDLVYKLVPGLYKDEMKRRREFYEKHPEAGPSQSANASEERGEVECDKGPEREEEKISLCLQHTCRAPPYVNSSSVSGTSKRPSTDCKDADRRHLLCPAEVSIGHLKKFIKYKFDLTDCFKIEVYHSDESLSDDYTLLDVAFLYAWKRREPLKLFYLVRDVTAQKVTSLPAITNEEPISDTDNTVKGKRKNQEDSVSSKKQKIENEADDDTAHKSDRHTESADVSAESSDTVIYDDQPIELDIDDESDNDVIISGLDDVNKSTINDVLGDKKEDGDDNNQKGGESKQTQEDGLADPTSPVPTEGLPDLEPASAESSQGQKNTCRPEESKRASPEVKNIFTIMSKVKANPPTPATPPESAGVVKTTVTEGTIPPPAAQTPDPAPAVTSKPTTSVRPLPLNKAAPQKTVLSPKRPGTLPPITINKRWIPNQVPVPKARPIAQKAGSSPPGGAGGAGGGGETPPGKATPPEPGSPGRGKLLLKGGKMGVPASLANTIGRSSGATNTVNVVKDKPPVAKDKVSVTKEKLSVVRDKLKRSSPASLSPTNEGKKEGKIENAPAATVTSGSSVTSLKGGNVTQKPRSVTSRPTGSIARALLTPKPSAPMRRVAPKPPTSRVAPTSRLGRPPVSPVNQAVVIPSGLKTFTVRPAGGGQNGFTPAGAVQVISPGGSHGPVTQIRIAGPLPHLPGGIGGKVPTTMVLTHSQMATLVGPGALRAPHTLAPRVTSPTSPSKVLNNSLPTGLSQVIDRLQYRSAKTLTFQPAVTPHPVPVLRPPLRAPPPAAAGSTQTVVNGEVTPGGQERPCVRSGVPSNKTAQKSGEGNNDVRTQQSVVMETPPATIATTVPGPGQGAKISKIPEVVEIENVPGSPSAPAASHDASRPLAAPSTSAPPCVVVVSSITSLPVPSGAVPAKSVPEQTIISVVEQAPVADANGMNTKSEQQSGTTQPVPTPPVPTPQVPGKVEAGCGTRDASLDAGTDRGQAPPATSSSTSTGTTVSPSLSGEPPNPYPGGTPESSSTPSQTDNPGDGIDGNHGNHGSKDGSSGNHGDYPPGIYADAGVGDSGLIMLANVAGAAHRGAPVPPPVPSPAPVTKDTTTPVSSAPAPSVSVTPTSSTPAPARSVSVTLAPSIPHAPAPSVSVTPVVTKTSVETQTQTADSLDEDLRRVQATVPDPANQTPPSVPRDADPANQTPPSVPRDANPANQTLPSVARNVPISPSIGSAELQEPPIKRLKMMCRGIEAERKEQPRPGQGQRKSSQGRQYVSSNGSMTPPGVEMSRAQFSPVLHRPPMPVPMVTNMVTNGTFIQPVIGVAPPAYFTQTAHACAPAPVAPAQIHHVVPPPIATKHAGRHGNNIRHGVARPMPNLNNNNKSLPSPENQTQNDPLANGYDAPLELTTKKVRDRKKSEEDLKKPKSSPIVVPNVMRS